MLARRQNKTEQHANLGGSFGIAGRGDLDREIRRGLKYASRSHLFEAVKRKCTDIHPHFNDSSLLSRRFSDPPWMTKNRMLVCAALLTFVQSDRSINNMILVPEGFNSEIPDCEQLCSKKKNDQLNQCFLTLNFSLNSIKTRDVINFHTKY